MWSRVYETVERPSVLPTVCPSVYPIIRQHSASLLLSAVRAEDIDRQRHTPGAQQHGAAARRSAANAGSVMLAVM